MNSKASGHRLTLVNPCCWVACGVSNGNSSGGGDGQRGLFGAVGCIVGTAEVGYESICRASHAFTRPTERNRPLSISTASDASCPSAATVCEKVIIRRKSPRAASGRGIPIGGAERYGGAHSNTTTLATRRIWCLVGKTMGRRQRARFATFSPLYAAAIGDKQHSSVCGPYGGDWLPLFARSAPLRRAPRGRAAICSGPQRRMLSGQKERKIET